MITTRRTFAIFALVLFTALMAQACGGSSGGGTPPTTPPPTSPIPDPDVGTPGDGLVIETRWVQIDAGGGVTAEFVMHDGSNIAVELTDLDGDPRFILAYIETVNQISGFEYTRYQNYKVNTVNGAPYEVGGVMTPPALAQTTQAGTDSGGTFTMINPGVYQYRFGLTVPPTYEMTATHTFTGYATRGGRSVVSNPVFHFVPDGSAVTTTREVAVTDTCNNCHSELAFHGGTRRNVLLCQTCHTDQTIDPESGNSVDFQEMIHRIHHGHELTNQPYFIVGFRQSVHDYSEVHFPQDTRNCTTCHQGGANSDNWKLAPSRASCGSCHDHIDWMANSGPTAHAGGPQSDDNGCRQCHEDVSGAEFDRHIPGAHTIPYFSSSNPELTFAITNVTNMLAGMTPTVSFTVSDKNGPVDLMMTPLNRLAVVFAATATDYDQAHSETIQGGGASGTLVPTGPGAYNYTPTWMLPGGASGTWAVGMEGRTNSVMVDTESISFGGNNPVVYVDTSMGDLGAGMPVMRREVIDEALCNVCHKDLVFHGNLRTDTEYCVMCHNTWGNDENRRPGVDPVTNRPESIDFRYMIHKIHNKQNLTKAFSIYGFGGTEHDFAHVHFPGDISKCAHCHKDGTWELPVGADLVPMVFNVGGVPTPQPDAIRGPTMAACTSCHDSDDAIAHALLNSIISGPFFGDVLESCSVCHGPGAAFDAANYHTEK